MVKMFGKRNTIVFLQYFLLFSTVNLKGFLDLAQNPSVEMGQIDNCNVYIKYFEETTELSVFKLYTSLTENTANNIESYTENVLWCLSRFRKSFVLKKQYVIPRSNFSQYYIDDFDMTTRKSAKARTNYEIWKVRKTTSRANKGVILVSENLDELLAYFTDGRITCWRCLYLLIFNCEKFKEAEIYQVLKAIWIDFNILNVIVHGTRSIAKSFLYTYNPFHIRYAYINI